MGLAGLFGLVPVAVCPGWALVAGSVGGLVGARAPVALGLGGWPLGVVGGMPSALYYLIGNCHD